MRFAYSFVALMVSVGPGATTVEAQEATQAQETVQAPRIDPGPTPPAPIATAAVEAAQAIALAAPARRGRPGALMPLYGGLVALQILDYASTRRAVSEGAGQEGNPLMSPIVGNRAAFLALKAGSTAGALWAGEIIWRRNRIGAVVFMAALDGAMAAVVAHNYSIRR